VLYRPHRPLARPPRMASALPTVAPCEPRLANGKLWAFGVIRRCPRSPPRGSYFTGASLLRRDVAALPSEGLINSIGPCITVHWFPWLRARVSHRRGGFEAVQAVVARTVHFGRDLAQGSAARVGWSQSGGVLVGGVEAFGTQAQSQERSLDLGSPRGGSTRTSTPGPQRLEVFVGLPKRPLKCRDA
jgi:hypothetical protein